MTTLHEALDHLVAMYLQDNPTRLPSTTTVLDLIEWSAARSFEAARAAAVAAADRADAVCVAEGRCLGCGQFLSATRVEMRIERCSRCDGTRKGRRVGRPLRR